MKYVKRAVSTRLSKSLFKGKAIILLDPRQGSKTTLMYNILDKQKMPVLYFNCDEADIRDLPSNTISKRLKVLSVNIK